VSLRLDLDRLIKDSAKDKFLSNDGESLSNKILGLWAVVIGANNEKLSIAFLGRGRRWWLAYNLRTI